MTKIFTDGASKGNPGPGGWGAIIADSEKVIEFGGAKKLTTNNEMELLAVVEALSRVETKTPIKIFLDSRYVLNGATKWIFSWQKRGWKTTGKTDVLYRDLWERLADLIKDRSVEWNHVSGHSGLVGNERVDFIASSFASGKKPELFSGAARDYSINISDVSYNKTKKESKNRSREKAYSYISAVNGKVETHETWAECEARVKGVSGARFKKSLNAKDEAGIIAAFSK